MTLQTHRTSSSPLFRGSIPWSVPTRFTVRKVSGMDPCDGGETRGSRTHRDDVRRVAT